jgi:hypothetical protein
MADDTVAAPADAEPLSAAKPEATPVASLARVESGTFLSDRPVYAFTLAPRETRSVEYALARAAEPTKSRWTRDVFGDVVHREFEKPGDAVEVTFDLSGMDAAGADEAAIRVGLLGARKGDKVNMKVGDFVCQLVQQDWFQSVTLPTVPRNGEIKAVFTLLARGEPEILPLRLRFGSATLALQGNGTFAATDSEPPADDAAVTARWSFDPAQPPASRMENPWSAATLSPARDRHVVEKGAALSSKLAATVDGGVRSSVCNSLLFRVPKSGWYRIAASGQLLARSAPTAGHALVTLYVLGHADREVKDLASLPLNTPGGFGGFPEKFDWKDSRRLEAGWTVALGLQTVSPGPGNAGSSTLDVTRFVIEELSAAKEAQGTSKQGNLP